jgi:large subunit ribosomal protein L19
MSTKLDTFSKQYLKANLPEIKPGDTVKVHQKIKEGEKERIQVFEGIVLAVKHGRGINSAVTVRKLVSGIGVERVFPLHLPSIEKIEVTKHSQVRRAKLYYLRNLEGKKAKLKRKKVAQ